MGRIKEKLVYKSVKIEAVIQAAKEIPVEEIPEVLKHINDQYFSKDLNHLMAEFLCGYLLGVEDTKKGSLSKETKALDNNMYVDLFGHSAIHKIKDYILLYKEKR